ncbi:hypothetical protein HYPSUDRAFT_71051 [Hypholoma sublateritium FD-334 SS-4]|uniref:TLC domain-containing protein n=1 Tax=Hypholoma sublateritium (strain FD-334 SS-4) TaxID=945553 RepID=A0A0D2NCQ5_HYPSF|nr:hypothetical protein HYPSUDRAFT_71051 [Hypholoma sublateritium FD-334 SS-4]
MVLLEKFIVETLGLTEFGPYLPTFYGALLVFTLIHLVIAPFVCARAIHIVSQVHVLLVVPCALWCIVHQSPENEQDRAFGWDAQVGYVHAIAAGCKPFVAYYGTRCLLWETSTFFSTTTGAFLDKTGRTGTRLQLVNGFFLIASFFLVRIVYGGTISVEFFLTLRKYHSQIPLLYQLVYGAGNFLLQGLNVFWFYKMIMALRKRFDTPNESTPLAQDAETTRPLLPQ